MFMTCPQLNQHSAIRHGFFTRREGHSYGLYHSLNCGYGSGDDLDVVARNRDKVAKALGTTESSLCTAYQIHSAEVVTLDKAWHWRDASEADALVTATPGLAIGVLTADCVPVLFFDPNRRVIGAAHAGWKGAYAGILSATIAAMEKLGAHNDNIIASIGPAIAQKSYEVGKEFYEQITAQNIDYNKYFIPSTKLGHHFFDLPGYVRARLQQAGIHTINMLANDTCFEEDAFFSFRRSTLRQEPAYGRQISAIILEP